MGCGNQVLFNAQKWQSCFYFLRAICPSHFFCHFFSLVFSHIRIGTITLPKKSLDSDSASIQIRSNQPKKDLLGLKFKNHYFTLAEMLFTTYCSGTYSLIKILYIFRGALLFNKRLQRVFFSNILNKCLQNIFGPICLAPNSSVARVCNS